MHSHSLKSQSITIIGSGRLGKVLQKVLEELHYSVQMLSLGLEIKSGTGLIFITTPDASIAGVCGKLASLLKDMSGTMVVHCSGIRPLEDLHAAKEAGAIIGCFHPLRAITKQTRNFAGITFDIMGDEPVVEFLKKLADHFGSNVLEVDEYQKNLLHLAAVFTSNYQITLAHLANKLGESAGLNNREVQAALLPLMQSALGNLESLDPASALTGPIARGDVATLEAHVNLLQNQPEILSLYKKLGVSTVQMLDKGAIRESTKNKMLDLLR
jgi:predicted short-subunit dehydrogenase-like oxidoreductase (DUF2520 family)